MTGNNHNALSIGRVDWWSILIYVALAVLGWINIYSVLHAESDGAIFDLSQRYGKQLVWIGISFFFAAAILLIDDKYYHILAYPSYWIAVLILFAVLFIGREVNGNRAWIYIGPVALQPTEFVKFTTALALARYMSRYTFSINRLRDALGAIAIIIIPAIIIILQKDRGSALVYSAFFIAMFREGMNGWFFVAVIMAAVLFISSLVLTPLAILAGLIAVCVIGEGLANGRWKSKAIYLSAVTLGAIALHFGSSAIMGEEGGLSPFASLLTSVGLSIVFVIIYAYRNRLRSVYAYIALFILSIGFTSTVDYIFRNVVEVHQQKRILDVLGLENDPLNWSYNANQSKIAIGSGGFLGKGFMQGTQTKFNFVPEQSTDFIFCTVGEEWGFVGSTIVVALFFLLVVRLLRMAERQREPFRRIYCYGAAAIFLMHIVINIGMTIGLVPVIGIPLPFFSYGGSSMLAFTILFFIAVKLDSNNRDL